MDLTTTPTHTTSNTTTNTASTKSPEPEPEPDTPTRIQTLAKPISFSNGVLKRHHHHPPPPPPPPAVTYRECLKNHAASLGGHALDGCGEFMPSPAATPADPTSIKCAACGCHRNFHRRDPDDFPHPAAAPSTQVIEYQPHHRHLPPPPHPPPPRSPDSASPPPISSSYYGHPVHPHHHHHHHRHHHHSTAPHVLLALSTAGAPEGSHPPAAAMVSPISRKRFRTKFTQVQKERMLEFAERVGWKIQKRDEDIIQELCHEIGVERGVLKVWMHNNKNRSSAGNNINVSSANDTNINSCAATENYDIPTSSQEMKDEANGGGDHHDHHHHQNHNHHHVGTNGSSSP